MHDHHMIWKPEVTVAAIIEKENHFLIVEELVEGKTVYNQPAGHLEDGETLFDATIRETLEETAWHFLPTAISGIYQWRHPDNGITFMRVCFTGDATKHDPTMTLDTGILGAKWMSREELAQNASRLRSPMVLQGIDDYLAGQRFPLTLIKEIHQK
jgi:NADH pyrophosphatase NudC (nudix superfamily)